MENCVEFSQSKELKTKYNSCYLVSHPVDSCLVCNPELRKPHIQLGTVSIFALWEIPWNL